MAIKKIYFFVIYVIFRPGPSLACSETMAMLFWRHTLHAFISFCCKVSPVKAEELMTEPLYYNDNIQVENKRLLLLLHRRWLERDVCHISHLLHEHGASLCLEDFDMKYGLNIGFPTQGSQICRKTVF